MFCCNNKLTNHRLFEATSFVKILLTMCLQTPVKCERFENSTRWAKPRGSFQYKITQILVHSLFAQAVVYLNRRVL